MTISPIDSTTLETMLDPFFAEQLDALQVPGAVFCLVQGEEIVLAKGYGLANRLLETPYDAEETIVHGGSIMKLLVATAVMQLAEQGQVDLHADVNTYLRRFQIPLAFNRPITLHHLLLHTAGLDVRFNSSRVFHPDDLEPMGRYLARALPPRLWPPGEIRNYNDYGYALAALVVQDASGVPLDRYLWDHLFQPLNMRRTMLLVPDEALPRLAIGYTLKAGQIAPNLVGNYLLQTGAGAAFNTTAGDMAHFLMAHLQHGRFHDRRILQAETAQQMQATHFRHHPRLPGVTYGFDEVFVNGRRLLAKSGGAPGMHNRLVLLPQAQVGFFVSYNRYHATLHTRLTQQLMDAFFPPPPPAPPDAPVTLTAAQQRQISGAYRELNGVSLTTFEKIGSLRQQIRVSAQADGSLALSGRRLQPVAADLFQWVDGGQYVAAGEDSRGKRYLFMARTAYEKLAWWETRPFQLSLLGTSLVPFLLGVIAWFNGAAGPASLLAALVGAGNLLFTAGLALFLLDLNRDGEPPWEIEYGLPTPLLGLLALPLITTFLAGLMGPLTVWAAVQGNLAFTAVIRNLFLLLGQIAFVACLRTWNLFGYKL